jgi:hypothetical protein
VFDFCIHRGEFDVDGGFEIGGKAVFVDFPFFFSSWRIVSSADAVRDVVVAMDPVDRSINHRKILVRGRLACRRGCIRDVALLSMRVLMRGLGL